MEFCRLKPKPPIIVYPFDNFFRHNNSRGGFNRNNFRHRGNHHHNHHQQNRNRNFSHQNRPHYGRDNRDSRDNRDNRYGDAKRFRTE